jgi:hypothetical protein
VPAAERFGDRRSAVAGRLSPSPDAAAPVAAPQQTDAPGAIVKAIRWAAVAATVLMSLMNLPVGLEAAEQDIPVALAWGASALGVLGLVAAAGLARRAPWGRPAVLAVGAVNAAGAVAAVVRDQEGAFVGLAVSAAILVLGAFATERAVDRPVASPSLG